MIAQPYSSGTCRTNANNLTVTQKIGFVQQHFTLFMQPTVFVLALLSIVIAFCSVIKVSYQETLDTSYRTCLCEPVSVCLRISQLTKCLITPQMSQDKTHRIKATSSYVFLRDHVYFTVLQSGKREWSHNFGVCLGCWHSQNESQNVQDLHT